MRVLITGDKKIEVSQENGEKIKELLLEAEPPKFVKIEGQVIKTANIIGVFKEDEAKSYKPAYMDYQWGDDELDQWEKEIFENHDTFKNYIISEGVINANGDIKDTTKYRMFIAKWNRLNELRSKREKQTGFIGRNKWLAEMRIRVAQLANKMSIRKEEKGIIKGDTKLLGKQVIDDLLKGNGKSAMKRLEYFEPSKPIEEPKEGSIEVDKIPF